MYTHSSVLIETCFYLRSLLPRITHARCCRPFSESNRLELSMSSDHRRIAASISVNKLEQFRFLTPCLLLFRFRSLVSNCFVSPVRRDVKDVASTAIDPIGRCSWNVARVRTIYRWYRSSSSASLCFHECFSSRSSKYSSIVLQEAGVS